MTTVTAAREDQVQNQRHYITIYNMETEFGRREDAAESILLMMIWGVGAILTTRLWFKLMDNPEITFGQWHVAHVLFGGLAMMGAILTLIVWRGEIARQRAIIMSGIGWGLFIDEVGKYITRDNDYWFKPAIIFIYMSFVLMYLFYWQLAKRERDGGRGLRLIRWVSKTFHLTYNRLLKKKMVMGVLGVYSIYYSIDKVIDAVRIILSREKMASIEYFYKTYDFFSRSDVYMIWGKIGSDALIALVLLAGWWWIVRKRRLKGLQYFKLGLLINIFLGSIFKFYFEQFSGVFSLILTTATYWIVTEMRKELRLKIG